MLAAQMLQRHGYRALTAASASEAQKVFSEHPGIDVLLSDVVMPGVSGPEMMAELRQQHPKLKVIYMSGYTDDAITAHGVAHADIAFLSKPFTVETLTRAIHAALQSGSTQ
jgi:two-component system, cell cycle sensor histidine kinase and response regulator CckA